VIKAVKTTRRKATDQRDFDFVKETIEERLFEMLGDSSATACLIYDDFISSFKS
jgi:hypothetical protein